MAGIPSSSANVPTIVEPSSASADMTPDNPALKPEASADINGPEKRRATPASQQSSSPLSSIPTATPSPPFNERSSRDLLLRDVLEGEFRQNVAHGESQPAIQPETPRSGPGAKCQGSGNKNKLGQGDMPRSQPKSDSEEREGGNKNKMTQGEIPRSQPSGNAKSGEIKNNGGQHGASMVSAKRSQSANNREGPTKRQRQSSQNGAVFSPALPNHNRQPNRNDQGVARKQPVNQNNVANTPANGSTTVETQSSSSSEPLRSASRPNQRMWAEVSSSRPHPTLNGSHPSPNAPIARPGRSIIRYNRPPPLQLLNLNHRAFDLDAQRTLGGIQQAECSSPSVPQQQHRQLPQSNPNLPRHGSQQLQRPLSSSVSLQYQHQQRHLQGHQESQNQRRSRLQNPNERQRLQPHPLSNSMRPPQSPVRSPGPKYPSGDIAQLFKSRLMAIVGGLEFPDVNEYVRRAGQVGAIMCNLIDAPEAAKPRARIEMRQPPTPAFGDTALGKIEVVSRKFDHSPPNPDTDKAVNAKEFRSIMLEGELGQKRCTFCTWECDYGISNESFWHPAEATESYCENCHIESSTFLHEWNYVVSTKGHNHNHVSSKRLDELRKLSGMPVLGLTAPRPMTLTKSKIDGRDTSRFQGVLFCKGCPWRQVDAKKTKICEPCKKEKFDIMRHRHESFVLIHAPEDPKNLSKGPPVFVQTARKDHNAKFRRCMICVGHAIYVCEGCPLRVCAECHTHLAKMCKHYLDNLFYFYNRDHIRNDAFLLRSDGGGM